MFAGRGCCKPEVVPLASPRGAQDRAGSVDGGSGDPTLASVARWALWCPRALRGPQGSGGQTGSGKARAGWWQSRCLCGAGCTPGIGARGGRLAPSPGPAEAECPWGQAASPIGPGPAGGREEPGAGVKEPGCGPWPAHVS